MRKLSQTWENKKPAEERKILYKGIEKFVGINSGSLCYISKIESQ